MRLSMIVSTLLFCTSIFGFEGGVEPILKKMEGLDTLRLAPDISGRIYDPFKRAAPLVKRGSKSQKIYTPSLPKVSAVMNDRAFINGRWIGVGERVAGFVLFEVKRGGAVLKKGKTLRYIPVSGKKRILTIKESR